ncbi:metallophosphoesterase [Paenibacillus sp. 1011MAR3C5]|uniref:metallophosphoesterase n=1 Tax=Paenibacillus sp. 1011MAR3C5 TaxID=1675787 RepID=UPI000E6BAF4C|nr:metallophosphoesterase [Paenibacillus sp. 1011MAR3C5]RJE88954.1 metallophosphoesterase [Paenibacillus sp. 1011MAR3C5]
MNLRAVFSIIGFLAIYGALAGYIGWNGWVFLSQVTGWESAVLYSCIIALLAFGYIAGRLAQAAPLDWLTTPLKVIGSYWLGLLQYCILLFPIADIAGLLLKWGGAEADIYITAVGGVVLLLLIFLLVLGSRNAWSPVIRTYQVRIPKPAGDRRKLTIAMASDLHLGTVIGNRHLHKLLRKVEEIKPDIILLPGDILDDDLAPFLKKGMKHVIGQLKAPLGVYAVTGNHEYYGGKVPEFVAEMNSIGIRVLMDETVMIGNEFAVVGRKDKAVGSQNGGRQSIKELVEPLDRSLPVIMLDHQPSDLAAAADNGVDLSLSGHTHRGQLAPNHLITRRMFELDWGYLRKGGLHAIVSSGFGFWGPPLRIGSRSEVLRIDVEFGDSITKE